MEELLDVEAMMIAPLHTVMSCYNLKGHGQMFYGGHVVALPRDIARLANAVPLLPEDLDAIIVRPPDLDPDEVVKLDAFTIRPAVIAHWLELLRIYHPAYKSGDIISEANLQTLRERLPAGADGFSVYEMLPHINAVGEDADAAAAVGPAAGPHAAAQPAAAGGGGDADADGQRRVADFTESLLLELSITDKTEAQSVTDALLVAAQAGAAVAAGAPVALDQPAVGVQPVSEHDASAHLLTLGWPHLFPEGTGDLVDPTRPFEITAADLLKHLLRHKSGRFARDRRLRYYLLNVGMRSQARRLASFYGHRNPTDAGLTVGDLRELSKDDLSELAQRVYRMSASLRGTPSYWVQAGAKLFAMIRVLASPALFYTLTNAALQWEDLHGLICVMRNPLYEVPAEDARPTEAERQRQNRTALNENPAFVAHYVHARFEIFFEAVLAPHFRILDHWHRFEWQKRGSGHIHGLGWCDGAPDLTTEPAATRERMLVEFWTPLLSAINVRSAPCPTSLMRLAAGHPARQGCAASVLDLVRPGAPDQRPAHRPAEQLPTSRDLHGLLLAHRQGRRQGQGACAVVQRS
jgi:hypothetical protein